MEKPEQIVVFKIQDEQFALPVLKVREIITTEEMKSITSEKEFVAGMVTIRGTIIPVSDFRVIMGKEKIEPNKKQRIIVMADEERARGLLVDNIVHVIRTKNFDFDEAPEEDHHLIKYTMKDNDNVIYLIEGKELGVK